MKNIKDILLSFSISAGVFFSVGTLVLYPDGQLLGVLSMPLIKPIVIMSCMFLAILLMTIVVLVISVFNLCKETDNQGG